VLELLAEGVHPVLRRQVLGAFAVHAALFRRQGDHHVVVVRAHADGAKLVGQLGEHLGEGAGAVVALVEVRPQAQQDALELAGEDLVLVVVVQDALNQLEQFGLIARAVVRLLGLLGRAAHGDRLQELELVAGVDKNAAGHLGARDAQHKLAHRLELAHQRGVVAVAGYDAEAVNQRVGVGHLHRVQHQQDVRVVLLRHAVAQGGDDGEGVGQQQFLEPAEFFGIAVDLAHQDIPADLDLLQDVVEGFRLAPGILQVDKNREARCTQCVNSFSRVPVLLRHRPGYGEV